MKRILIWITALALLFSFGCSRVVSSVPAAAPAEAQPEVTEAPTAEPTATPDPTPEPTPTATPEPDENTIRTFTVTGVIITAFVDDSDSLSGNAYLTGTLDGGEETVTTAKDGVWFKDCLPTTGSVPPGTKSSPLYGEDGWEVELDEGSYILISYDLGELGKRPMRFEIGMSCHCTYDGQTVWLVYDELLGA